MSSITDFCVHLLTTLLLILQTQAYHTNSNHRASCLQQNDVNAIIHNWSSLFTRPVHPDFNNLVNQTVTDDIIAVDNSINFLFGIPGDGPYATNKTAFAASTGAINPAVSDETFETIYVEFNCHSITYRWEASATAVGANAMNPNNTATPNSQFTFKGTDLLHISHDSNLIERVDSSGDYIPFLYYSGVAVAFQVNVARDTCLPINEPPDVSD